MDNTIEPDPVVAEQAESFIYQGVEPNTEINENTPDMEPEFMEVIFHSDQLDYPHGTIEFY